MNAYVARCKRERLPIAYVRTSNKYAFVELDLIYVPNSSLFHTNAAFKDEMIAACEKATGKPYKGLLPGTLTTVRHTPVDKAQQLVTEFLAIYDRHK